MTVKQIIKTKMLEFYGHKKLNTNTLDGFIQTELDLGVSPKQILTAFENYIIAEVERRDGN